MTAQQMRGYVVRAGKDGAVTFLASTDTDEAADGLVIEQSGWDLRRFLKGGGPILWAHDYSRPPIGKAANVRVTDAGLTMDVIFDETSGDEFARMVAAKVRAGIVNAISVGFDVLESVGKRVTKAVLLEASIVPVGADPNAVALARSAFQGSTQYLEETLLQSYLDKVTVLELGASLRKRAAELAAIEQRLGDEACERLIRRAVGRLHTDGTDHWDFDLVEDRRSSR